MVISLLCFDFRTGAGKDRSRLREQVSSMNVRFFVGEKHVGLSPSQELRTEDTTHTYLYLPTYLPTAALFNTLSAFATVSDSRFEQTICRRVFAFQDEPTHVTYGGGSPWFFWARSLERSSIYPDLKTDYGEKYRVLPVKQPQGPTSTQRKIWQHKKARPTNWVEKPRKGWMNHVTEFSEISPLKELCTDSKWSVLIVSRKQSSWRNIKVLYIVRRTRWNNAMPPEYFRKQKTKEGINQTILD